MLFRSDGLIPPYSFFNHSYASGGTILANPGALKAAYASQGVTDSQFYCPLDQLARTGISGNGDSHNDTSYLESAAISKFRKPAVDWIELRISDIPYPAQSWMIGDAGSGRRSYDRHRWYSNHGEQFNALYFDWHVKSHSTYGLVCSFPGMNSECPE